MQSLLGGARFRGWHQLGAGQIGLPELIGDQQMTRRVAVEQMMAAGEPEVARYAQLPFTCANVSVSRRLGIKASRYQAFDLSKVYTFRGFRASVAGQTTELRLAVNSVTS